MKDVGMGVRFLMTLVWVQNYF